ncbi:hypothetical protein Plhal304r1_c078g0165101 [Plasmopara halstedii]
MEVHKGASRLLTCARLDRESDSRHQNAIKRPLIANWHEKIGRNGQVYISISSEEDEEMEDKEREDASIEQSTLDFDASRRKQPDIVTIDSSSDEEVELVRVKRNLRGQEEQDANNKKEKAKSKAVDANNGKKHSFIEEKEIEREKQLEFAVQKPQKLPRQIATRASVVRNAHHVAKVRKRRLGEEDAAFLLFYGHRETPNASILRLIIELISTGVGAPNKFLSKFIKYLLWCKLSSTVDAGLAYERLVQSEWTKIVFSCPVPPHRRRSGPMPRPTLLTRPITITVQPLQLVRKQPQRRSLCVSVKASSAKNGDKCESVDLYPTPDENIEDVAKRSSEKSLRSKPVSKSPKKSTNAAQTKSPRGEVRKRPLNSTKIGTMISSNAHTGHIDTSSPRKHQRRDDRVALPLVNPRQVVQATSLSAQSISQKLMEPLPCDCRILGENWSLPYGWRPIGHDQARSSLMVTCVEVNPMLRMTADEIALHIASVHFIETNVGST